MREMPEIPECIRWRGGDEYDVLDPRARTVYVYTKRAGVCHRVKRGHRRRFRHMTRTMLRFAFTTVVMEATE